MSFLERRLAARLRAKNILAFLSSTRNTMVGSVIEKQELRSSTRKQICEWRDLIRRRSGRAERFLRASDRVGMNSRLSHRWEEAVASSAGGLAPLMTGQSIPKRKTR